MLKFSFTNNLLDVPDFKQPKEIVKYFEDAFGAVSREVFAVEQSMAKTKQHKNVAQDIFALAAVLPDDETTAPHGPLQSDIIEYQNKRYKILLEEPTPSNIPTSLINTFGQQACVFRMQRKAYHGKTGNERFQIYDCYSAEAFERCKEEHILRQTAANIIKHRFSRNIR